MTIGPTGRWHHAPTLDALFDVLPRIGLRQATGQPSSVVSAPTPAGWDIQAALVWLAAASAAGIIGSFDLPVGSGMRLAVELPGGGTATASRLLQDRPDDAAAAVCVVAAGADNLLESLCVFGSVGTAEAVTSDRL